MQALPQTDSDFSCETHAYINGEWVDGSAQFDVTNPATGELLAQIADVGVEETKQAIKAAQTAFPEWRDKTAKERATILRRWFNLIIANQEELAQILTAEQGKPLAESRSEIAYGASFVEWFAEEGKRMYGDVIPSHGADKRIITIKQPVGVVAAITPWNFPSAMITRKVAPALAAGCTVIIKPAAFTPLSALTLAQLAEQAGIPRGVINIITSTDSKGVGQELCSNPVVRKLSFTGSTAVGKILMRQCADTVKKLSLELGGNAPFIVFDDADLDAAVAGAMMCKYRNAGQTCVCANRILVQDTIYDAFIAKFKDAVSKLVLGNGTEDGVTTGPLIDADALASVDKLVQDAIKKGAQASAGGKPSKTGALFYEPTILENITDEMDISREEIFGPVAPIFTFSSEADAITLANDTPYGLAAYFYTRDVGRIWRVAEGLEYGIVGINEGIISTEVAPFGGIKESGFGKEGSKYGMDDFVEIKYLCMGGIK